MIRSIFFMILSLTMPRSASAIESYVETENSFPLAYVNVLIKAGSTHDPAGKLGLAQLVTDLMLRGSRSRSKTDIERDLDQIGARLDVEVRDEAILFRGVTLKEHFAEFLKILEDVLLRPTFPEEELRRLKTELSSEILAEQSNDRALARKRFDRLFFGTHPYGNPRKGLPTHIQSIARSDVARHYQSILREDSIVVVGGGDISESDLSSFVQKLGKERAGKAERPTIAPFKPRAEKRFFLIDKPERTQTQLVIGVPGLAVSDPRLTSFSVAEHVFGGGSFSARLMTEIRAKRGLSYGAYAFLSPGKEPRYWAFQSFPSSKDAATTLGLSLQLLKDFYERGITNEEFEFARESLLNSEGFRYNTLQKRMENILVERSLDLPIGFIKSTKDRLKAVTRDSANRAVREVIKLESLTILLLGTAESLKKEVAQASGISVEKIKIIPASEE